MGIEAGLPIIIIVLTAALVNALGPGVIGVFVLVVSAAMSAKISKRRLFGLGLVYLLSLAASYYLLGLAVMSLLQRLPVISGHYLALLLALLVIAAGLIGLKDYFWYNHGFSLKVSDRLPKQIHHIAKQVTVLNLILLGIYTAIVMLPCTGFLYLALVVILSQSYDLAAAGPLVLYNILFIAPLLVSLFLITQDFDLHLLKSWKQASRRYMRLAAGLLLIALGWVLLLMANGSINFG